MMHGKAEADSEANKLATELKGMTSTDSFEKFGKELEEFRKNFPTYYSSEIKRINDQVDMRQLGFATDIRLVGFNKSGQFVTESEDGKQLQFRKPGDMSAYDFKANESGLKKMGQRDFTVAGDGSAQYKVKPGDSLWTVAKDALFRDGKKPADNEVANLIKRMQLERKGKPLQPGETLQFPPLTVKGDLPSYGKTDVAGGASAGTAPAEAPKGDGGAVKPAVPGAPVKPEAAKLEPAKPDPAKPKPFSNAPDAGINPTGDAGDMRAPGVPPKDSAAAERAKKIVDEAHNRIWQKKTGDLGAGGPAYEQTDSLNLKGELLRRKIEFGPPGASLYFPDPDGGKPRLISGVRRLDTTQNGDGSYETFINCGNGSIYRTTSREGQVLKFRQEQAATPAPLLSPETKRYFDTLAP